MRLKSTFGSILALALTLPAIGGELEPSSPPGPTMKTLVEVEPRQAISDADAPLIIFKPGSYYLTENLIADGFGQDAITIEASGVTVDLMGFAIQGSEVGIWDTGIIVVGELDSIVVKNGTVRDCAAEGIDLNNNLFPNSAVNSRVERVRVIDNGGVGVWVDENSLISDSVAMGNGSHGFQLSGARIHNSTSFENDGYGFFASNRSTISDCTAKDNTGYGAFISVSTIVNSHLRENSYGIYVTNGPSSVVANEVHNNSADGIHVPVGVPREIRIDGNNVTRNGGWAISVVAQNNLIVRNLAADNDTGNYSINANNAVGAILDVSNSTITTSNPWRNLEY